MKNIKRLFVVERGREGDDQRETFTAESYSEALKIYRNEKTSASYEAEASKRPQSVAMLSYTPEKPVKAEFDGFGRLIGEDGEEIEYFNQWREEVVFNATVR